jgi:hypothetical protein
MPDYTQLIDQLTAQGQTLLADPTLDPATRQMLSNSMRQLRDIRREPTPPDPSFRFEGTQYTDMYFEAAKRGFHVVAGKEGGHNTGSLHPKGRAIDVRTRDKSGEDISQLNIDMMTMGYSVRDERTLPAGQQKWTGPHMHYSAPRRDQRDYSLGVDTSLRRGPYDFRPAPATTESNLNRSSRQYSESLRQPLMIRGSGHASQ